MGEQDMNNFNAYNFTQRRERNKTLIKLIGRSDKTP